MTICSFAQYALIIMEGNLPPLRGLSWAKTGMLWCSCWPGLHILVGRQHIGRWIEPLSFYENDYLQLCADFMEGNLPLRGLSWARQSCCGVPAGLDCKFWWVGSRLATAISCYHFYENGHSQLCADFMEGNLPLRGLSWARQSCCGVPAGLDCKFWWVGSRLATAISCYHFMKMDIRSFALISWKATSHSEGSAGPDSHAVVFLLAWIANSGG